MTWMGLDPESGAAFPTSLSMVDIVALVGRALLADGDEASAARSLSVVIQVRGGAGGAAALRSPRACVWAVCTWARASKP